MLDLHALTLPAGVAALTDLSVAANIPANDGQSAPGVPIAPGAVLKGWGFQALATCTGLIEAQLISQDQIDPINGEHWKSSTSVLLALYFDAYLPYSRGKRALYINSTAQNDVAGYMVDQYPSPVGANVKNFGQMIKLPQVFGGALTANVWGSVVVAPASNIPAGTYALLGVYLGAITDVALIRFEHADFGGKKPGFPAVDETKAISRSVTPMGCPVFNNNGSQFRALGDIPIFRATSAGTGLTIGMLSMVADTPTVTLVLVQLS
jgi:hypothetical protein